MVVCYNGVYADDRLPPEGVRCPPDNRDLFRLTQEDLPMIRTLGTEFVHFFVLEQDGEVTLIDAGLSGYRNTLEPALAEMGRSIDDVKAIVLTHADPDHVGFARALRHMITNGGAKQSKVPEVIAFGDGDELEVPGRLRVVHTPGIPRATASSTPHPRMRCSSATPSTTSISSPENPARSCRQRPPTRPPTRHMNRCPGSRTWGLRPCTSGTATHRRRERARPSLRPAPNADRHAASDVRVVRDGLGRWPFGCCGLEVACCNEAGDAAE